MLSSPKHLLNHWGTCIFFFNLNIICFSISRNLEIQESRQRKRWAIIEPTWVHNRVGYSQVIYSVSDVSFGCICESDTFLSQQINRIFAPICVRIWTELCEFSSHQMLPLLKAEIVFNYWLCGKAGRNKIFGARSVSTSCARAKYFPSCSTKPIR